MTDSPLQPLQPLVDRYIAYLVATGHPSRTVTAYRKQLEYFVYWADEHPLRAPALLGQYAIEAYVAHLLHGIDLHTTEPVTIRQSRERAAKLRRFLTWVYKKGHIQSNQAAFVPPITRRGKSSAKTCAYNSKS